MQVLASSSEVRPLPGWPEKFAPVTAESEATAIRAILEQTANRSVGSPELAAAVRDWTTYYHLSAQRTWFLRPLRQLLRGRILEVASECGALTRFLGETGGETGAR